MSKGSGTKTNNHRDKGFSTTKTQQDHRKPQLQTNNQPTLLFYDSIPEPIDVIATIFICIYNLYIYHLPHK